MSSSSPTVNEQQHRRSPPKKTSAPCPPTTTSTTAVAANDPRSFVYDVDENPDIIASIVLSLQVALTCFGGNLVCAVVCAKILCANNTAVVEAELFTNILFTSGIATWLQVTFGTRLPLYQGGNSGWLAAVVSLTATSPLFQCPQVLVSPSRNETGDDRILVDALRNTEREIEEILVAVQPNDFHNMSEIELDRSIWVPRYQMILGGLFGASIFQILVGLTGVASFAMKYVGPLTAAPVLIHITLILCPVALDMSAKHWGFAFLTCALVFIYSFCLAKYSFPMSAKAADKNGSRRTFRCPIFSVGGLFLAMLTSWILSALVSTWLDDDSPARIDSKIAGVRTSAWIGFPLPFRYGGWPTMTAGTFALAIIVAIASIVESLGDYMAMALVCNAKPMPKHAINRGIALEGFGCLIGSLIGAPAPVTTYSNVTGIVLVTRVASRRILQLAGLITAACAIVPKLGAVLVSIPEPIIGGVGLAIFGMVFSVGIGLLRNVDMDSARNLAVLGASVVIGTVVPNWVSVANNQKQLTVGVPWIDQCLHVLLGTPLFVGSLVGFVLDNTLPATQRERGLEQWSSTECLGVSPPSSSAADRKLAQRIERLYSVPLLHYCYPSDAMAKWLPFLPPPPSALSPVNDTEVGVDDGVTPQPTRAAHELTHFIQKN